MAEKKKELSFEEALKRLEFIVRELETGQVSLEKMMDYFEEGTQLVKFCTARLNEVERKIEVLLKKGDAVVREPFDAERLTGSGEEEEPPGGETGEGPF